MPSEQEMLTLLTDKELQDRHVNMQMELKRRLVERGKAAKEEADRKRQEVHKENIWLSLKSYGDKYGHQALNNDFGHIVATKYKLTGIDVPVDSLRYTSWGTPGLTKLQYKYW